VPNRLRIPNSGLRIPVSSARVNNARKVGRFWRCGILLGLALAALGCGDGTRQPILVFAAASLEDAMLECAAAYTGRSGASVSLNTAGSNVLAQQIRAGAPADVFVSADARWIDDLIASGSLDRESRRELLTNRLVVIGHAGRGMELSSLSEIGSLPFRYLSIADPDSVPAGRYARSLLEHTSLSSGTAWDEVASRVAPAPDVRAALAMVAAEPDAVGIVYRSDVVGVRRAAGDGVPGDAGGAQVAVGHVDPAIEVLLEIDREPDPPIRYVGALVRRPQSVAGAAALLDFLAGPEAKAIFERHGFVPLPQGP
jgi:molybdate transport system substrate-binding protein